MRNQQQGFVKFFLVVVMLGAVAGLVSFVMIEYLNPGSDKKGYENKEKLNKAGDKSCLAEGPSCGYCPGTVIKDYCYWNDAS